MGREAEVGDHLGHDLRHGAAVGALGLGLVQAQGADQDPLHLVAADVEVGRKSAQLVAPEVDPELARHGREQAPAALLVGQLRATADDLNVITGKIAAGEGSIGKLVHAEETVDNLNQTLDSIDTGAASLKDVLDRSRRWRLAMVVRGDALPTVEESRTGFGFDLRTTVGEGLAARLPDGSLVVRSSAPGEDGAGESFAGLHDSFVDVRGLPAVIEAIRAVWASLWSDRALLCRRELGLDVERSTMAVAIQELVAGDVYDLAVEEFATALRQEGMLALAKLQRKLRLLESPYRTPQTLVGGPRFDAALMASSGRTATTRAMGRYQVPRSTPPPGRCGW